MIYLRKLNGQVVTLLKERLFLHVILGEDFLVIAVGVLVGTVFVHAGGVLEEELAILGAAEGGFHESALKDEGIDGKHGD